MDGRVCGVDTEVPFQSIGLKDKMKLLSVIAQAKPLVSKMIG